MSTAGSVGVGSGVDVEASGGVLVEVGLGEGWGVAVDGCALEAQAANINELRKIK